MKIKYAHIIISNNYFWFSINKNKWFLWWFFFCANNMLMFQEKIESRAKIFRSGSSERERMGIIKILIEFNEYVI